MKLRASAVALCCWLAVQTNAASLERQITSFSLPNGMTWIVLERPGSGKVTTNFYYDVGTVYEPAGRTGVSQMVGYYMRQEAHKAGWKDYRTWINPDHQCAINVVTTERFEEWMQFEAKRIVSQTFPDNIEPAKIVQREYIDKLSANGAWLLEELQRVALLNHPYRNPRWGLRADVDALAAADLRSFYKDRFVPANLIVVVAGDITASTVRRLAEDRYGSIPAGRKAEPLGQAEPPRKSERRIVARAEAGPALAIAYPKGAVRDDSYPVWDVLAPAIASRLKTLLVEKQRLAERVNVHYLPAMKYEGLLGILVFLKPGINPAPLEKIVTAELQRFVDEPMNKADLATAAKAWAGERPMSDDQLAQELGDWQAMTGDYTNMFRHRARVEAVKAEQVQSLARQTFGSYNRTVAVAAP